MDSRAHSLIRHVVLFITNQHYSSSEMLANKNSGDMPEFLGERAIQLLIGRINDCRHGYHRGHTHCGVPDGDLRNR